MAIIPISLAPAHKQGQGSASAADPPEKFLPVLAG